MSIRFTQACPLGFAFLLFALPANSQTIVDTGKELGPLRIVDGRLTQHEKQWVAFSGSDEAESIGKTATLTGNFTASLPNGGPRSGVPGFVMEYNIVLTSDSGTENVDYFAFSAPSGWTITAIGPAPPQTACTDNPHTSIISGFSATSAYWGGDYGGGVVTPGSPGTYPASGARSSDGGGCGAYSTAISPAAADTITLTVQMTPSASGTCPGSTTNAVPLCCAGTEISAGNPPPAGSEPYFTQMIGASDENASVFGDVWYYVALSCPPPFVQLHKFPLEAPIQLSDCATAIGETPFPPDTLVIPDSPGSSAQFCYRATNFSQVVSSDPYLATECDSLFLEDDSLGVILDANGLTFGPGDVLVALDDSVLQAPTAGTCWPNSAVVFCTTPEGFDYVLNTGVIGGERNTSNPAALGGLGFADAAVCAVTSLPVELTSFRATSVNGDVLLQWVTASESNNAGFMVEHRFVGETDFESIGYLEGAGTSSVEHRYEFRVADTEPGSHVFRLRQIDFDGAFQLSQEIEVETEVVGAFRLTEAYPNPFSQSSQVALTVSVDQDVSVTLFDAAGRVVTTIYSGIIPASRRVLIDVDAKNLAAGTYLLRVVGDRFAETRSLTVSR